MLKIQLRNTGINYILKHIPIENSIFRIVIIFHNITVLLYFDQINAGLVSRRDFFQTLNHPNV